MLLRQGKNNNSNQSTAGTDSLEIENYYNPCNRLISALLEGRVVWCRDFNSHTHMVNGLVFI